MDSVVVFVFTKIASTEGFMIASGLMAAFLLARHGVKRAGIFLASAGVLMLSVYVLKNFFEVARPAGALIEVTGYAFPSGHAAGAAFLALSLGYLVRKVNRPTRYGIFAAALLIALLIGASRITFQVHTPFQVMAGYALGALCFFLFIRLARTTKQ